MSKSQIIDHLSAKIVFHKREVARFQDNSVALNRHEAKVDAFEQALELVKKLP